MSLEATGGSARKQRVVVLGGGAAGVAAAFWLTAPEQNGRYEVTLYTQGWRLGGKCASGRNADIDSRIEEHGLHMLMGCYQNAFATIRACYKEWQRSPTNPFQTWQDAFLPQRHITLMEKDGPGTPPTWAPWDFPNIPRLPGEPGDEALASAAPGASTSALDRGDTTLLLTMADRLGQLHPAEPYDGVLKDALAHLRAALKTHSTTDTTDAVGALRKANQEFGKALASARSDPAAVAARPADYRLLILANLGIAIGIGYLRDIKFGGADAYDTLNTQDFRTWLQSCDAFEPTLNSAPVRAIYDLAFAFVGGQANNLGNGSMAAGVTLRFALELAFGYRDAPLWKMAAGMGDTVFTPFYDVLTARRTNIQFFNRVTSIRPTNDGRVGEIDLMQQAQTVDGAPYRPLTPVNNLDCWPNQPDWNQLVNGAILKAAGTNFESSYCTVSVGSQTLKVDTDFDIAVIAIPPAALTEIAAPLAQSSAAWQTALSESRSVATQSLQLWMKPTLADLGWTLGSTVLTAFAEPYDSWADMSHLLSRETWSGANAPRSIGYFCGCLQVPAGLSDPGQMQQLAAKLADDWLAANIRILWPNAFRLQGPDPRIVSRYGVANFDISDQYVQTPAGNNVASRFLPSAAAGFGNLYVVGDWTKTRFSGGCFESTIESAMLASRAISGFPTAVKTA